MSPKEQIDFKLIKQKVTIIEVAKMLQLPIQREGNGYRCSCRTGDRSRKVRITPGHENDDGSLGAFYCHACKTGGDLIKFCAHMTQTNNYEAAALIAKHFGVGTVAHSAASPAQKAEPEGRREGLKPLGYLLSDHEVIEMLGLSAAACDALGAGFAPKGTMSGRILVPLRLPSGELVGYLGIAARPDQTPLLKFPDNLDERCNVVDPLVAEPVDEPKKHSMDEMRHLLRVVGDD